MDEPEWIIRVIEAYPRRIELRYQVPANFSKKNLKILNSIDRIHKVSGQDEQIVNREYFYKACIVELQTIKFDTDLVGYTFLSYAHNPYHLTSTV